MERKRTCTESNFISWLGLRIRDIRTEKGWSQRATARRLKVSYNRLNRIERARVDPKISFLLRLAAVFGMTVAELLSPPAPSGDAS